MTSKARVRKGERLPFKKAKKNLKKRGGEHPGTSNR